MNIICILIQYWLRTCKIRIAYSRQDCMQAHSAGPTRRQFSADVIITILFLSNTCLATGHCVFGWIREFGQFSSERLPTFQCICSRYQQSRYLGVPQMHSQITILLLILSNISVPEQKDLSKLWYRSSDLCLSGQAPSPLSYGDTNPRPLEYKVAYSRRLITLCNPESHFVWVHARFSEKGDKFGRGDYSVTHGY